MRPKDFSDSNKDFSDSKKENTSIVEDQPILITNKIIKFGDSIYQLRNVTDFQVKEIPKKYSGVLLLTICFFLSGLFCFYSAKKALSFIEEIIILGIGLIFFGISGLLILVQFNKNFRGFDTKNVLNLSQLKRNFTGFKKADFPKKPFPVLAVIICFLISLLLSMFEQWSLSLIFFGISALIAFVYFVINKYYGLIINLNSGQTVILMSHSKVFLSKIVDKMYNFIQNNYEGSLHIDLSNRSINVEGNFDGSATTGDQSNINQSNIN